MESISTYLKERKRKESLMFKIKLMRSKGQDVEALEKELESIQVPNLDLSFIPEIEKINKLTQEIDLYPPYDIINAIKEKKGVLWDKIKERNILWERVLYLENEIAYLVSLIKEDMYEKIGKFLKGELEELEGDEKLLRALEGLGLALKLEDGKIKRDESREDKLIVIYEGKKYWMEKNKAKEFEELLNKLDRISLEIQMKNAKRQIKADTNDNEFEKLQKEYLELIKKRDEMLV